MSEEVSSAEVSTEPTATPEATEAHTGYIPPEDADEFVPTKWNKYPESEESEDGDEDAEQLELEPEVEVEEETEDDIDEFLKPGGQMVMLKIDGKEVPKKLEEVIADAQKFAAGDKRMQEAAMLKKQVVNLMHGLKSDPFSVLMRPEFGFDEKDFREKAEEWLYDKVKYDQMSDEERAKYDKLRKLEALEKEKEEWEKQKKDEQTKAYKEMYSQKIMAALDASDLPKQPQVIKRIAYYIGQGLQKGVRLEPQDVIPFVKKEMVEDYKALTKDEKALAALMDEETVQAVKKRSLESAKKPKLSTPKKQGKPTTKAYKPKKKMGLREFRERNKAMFYGDD